MLAEVVPSLAVPVQNTVYRDLSLTLCLPALFLLVVLLSLVHLVLLRHKLTTFLQIRFLPVDKLCTETQLLHMLHQAFLQVFPSEPESSTERSILATSG